MSTEYDPGMFKNDEMDDLLSILLNKRWSIAVEGIVDGHHTPWHMSEGVREFLIVLLMNLRQGENVYLNPPREARP